MGPGSAADIVTFYFLPAPPGRIDEVVLDASSGRVLERARGADEPISVLYRFHATLFAGVTGGWVVGALGGVLATSLLSGLWLWWPRRGQWRWALAVRSPRVGALGFTFDLHKATGMVGGAALLVAAVTGVALAYPTFTASILTATFPSSEAPALSLHPALRVSSFPLERLVSIGRARFPIVSRDVV